MNIKQKFEKAKKKYQENQIAVDAAIVAGCLATAAFCLHVIKRIDEVREDIAETLKDVEAADAKIREVNDAAKHVRETGHSVTFYNGRDEPMFIMTPVPDEN
jgi:tRNA/tmRNA/rRNA uracil-C5-methylase (TrmA/RlmC/RlmD family)